MGAIKANRFHCLIVSFSAESESTADTFNLVGNRHSIIARLINWFNSQVVFMYLLLASHPRLFNILIQITQPHRNPTEPHKFITITFHVRLWLASYTPRKKREEKSQQEEFRTTHFQSCLLCKLTSRRFTTCCSFVWNEISCLIWMLCFHPHTWTRGARATEADKKRDFQVRIVLLLLLKREKIWFKRSKDELNWKQLQTIVNFRFNLFIDDLSCFAKTLGLYIKTLSRIGH